jgi:hypothetical protein
MSALVMTGEHGIRPSLKARTASATDRVPIHPRRWLSN